MGRIAEQNPFGVAGARWIALDPGNPKPVGCGHHGGWGSDETQPFLIVNHADVPVGIRSRRAALSISRRRCWPFSGFRL
jgi:hypothetical protein